MKNNATHMSMHERRVGLVSETIMQHSKVAKKEAIELARQVVYTLDHMPEKVR